MKRTITLLILLILLLWGGSALAMSSPNYQLDWFTPMTGGGGGPASSTQYTVNLTVGPAVVGVSAREHCGSGLGYWFGILSDIYQNFLALVMN